jgi:CRISPR system Cascade subunit CasE
MFLSRVELTPSAAEREAFWRDISKPYNAHQALWKLLGRAPEQKREFLFCAEPTNARVSFLVLSREAPAEDGEGVWVVDAKRFNPTLGVGQRLGFRLRASPVVSRKGARHDVVMDRKRAMKAAGSVMETEPDLVRQAGLAWLQRQSARAGFKLADADLARIGDGGLLEGAGQPQVALRVDGYQQHRLRSGPKHAEMIRFSTLDFEGLLEVTDPVVFLEKVKTGFGPQKAFGCGLMLLRRA